MLAIVIILMVFVSEKKTIKSDIYIQTENDIISFSNIFLEETSILSTDIFLIADLLSVHDSLIIDNGKTIFDSAYSKEIIETEFLVWLQMKDTYDQIRIIDNTGQEIVRANYNSGLPYIVDELELQNKADRYYFTESINLEARQLYMSPLDLNIENGEIEIVDGNTKPMLRVATPIFNDAGTKLGVVLVNYLAGDLFNRLKDSQGYFNSNIEIINENGFYLYSDNEAMTFGFMYDDLIGETYSKYHSYDIFEIPSGEIVVKDFNDVFYTAMKITSTELTDAANTIGQENLDIIFAAKEFIIFTRIDITENATYQRSLQLYIIVALVTFIIGLIISRLIDESMYLKEENINRIRHDATHDLLTNLPNRKNIYEQMNNLIKKRKQFTVLFIDFDGFKSVNDTYGHDVGDETLILGSKRIESLIREEDVLGRIGGDEFIVVLPEMSNLSDVAKTCNLIINSFKKKFIISGKNISIGASIGAYRCAHLNVSATEIISKADQAMYKVKRSGKNDFLIINDTKEEK